METKKNAFSNEEITVTFHPKKCINAAKCANGLSQVFRTSVIPWIDLDAAAANRIAKQVRKCPSGALQCVMHENAPQVA
ncbi:MAG: (4Fe-4S)-binding protein [Gilvibacter sp.]